MTVLHSQPFRSQCNYYRSWARGRSVFRSFCFTGRAYREREKRRQLRNDLGPKLKIRKVPPVNRDNAGNPLRRRNYNGSYLYSTNLTLLANALREIRHYQKQVGLVFARSSFNRLVKQICDDELRSTIRWRASALAALQYAAEL
jgi:hypothetical protein